MNILHLRSSGGLYGAEQVILNLSGALQELQVHCHIVCINNDKNQHLELIDEAKQRGISAEAVFCQKRYDRKTIQYIRKILIEKKINILHCHDFKATMFGICAARKLKIRKVATNHLWTKANWKLRVYEFIEGMMYRYCDHVVAVSEEILKEVEDFVSQKEKLSWIPNGIDLKRFDFSDAAAQRQQWRESIGLSSEHIVIGNIARLSVEKNQALLIKTFADIVRESKAPYHLRLLIAGDGPERDHLKKLTQDLKIDEQCLFLGVREDVPEILNSLDVYVQSSIREGLPIVLLEAMASQCVIVTTNAGGISKVISDQTNGLLVPSGDEDALMQAIDQVIDNLEGSQKYGQAARELVEKEYSAQAMARKYQQIYQGILS